MTDRFNVQLKGFADEVADPIDALMNAFGVSATRAERILSRLPVVVKRDASDREALSYAKTLLRIGAQLAVLRSADGAEVSLRDVAGFSRTGSGVIESADPLANGGQVPRAAFVSGMHPALNALSAGVSGNAALTSDTAHDPTPPPGSLTNPPPPPVGLFAFEEDVADDTWIDVPETDRPPEPLIQLESSSPGLAGAGESLPPLEAARVAALGVDRDNELELDEAAIPAGRSGALVPAMPAVLKHIRDFESTDWRPIKPGLGVIGPTASPLTGSPGGGSDPWPRARNAVDPRGVTTDGAAIPAGPVVSGPRPATRDGRRLAQAMPGTDHRTLIVGGIVAAAVIVGIVLIASLGGGVSSELEAALDELGERYLPTLDRVATEGGQLASLDADSLTYELQEGRCYGWIATTLEPSGCDLDLALSRPGQELMYDNLLNSTPVVFHCPDADTSLALQIGNAGSASCRYGLAQFERLGSLSWPLEPYLTMYADYLAGLQQAERLQPIGDILHGDLSGGEVDEFELTVPAGQCRTILAVSRQGTDLDLSLLVNERVVDNDVAVDNYPIVSHCAEGADVRVKVRVTMYSGASDYVRQLFNGTIGQL